MPRVPSFPLLYEDLKSFSISDLSRWGYVPYCKHLQSGSIEWSRNGKVNSSISITCKEKSIELSYSWRDEEIRYTISLESIRSNLGKGKVLYFVCPITKLRCRKLYLINGRFSHRTAQGGAYYESQLRSKYMRFLDTHYKDYFIVDKLYSEIQKKHFKKTYKGRLTKRYVKLKTRINHASRISREAVMRTLVKG